MDPVKTLTPAQCVLLAVHFASESNVKALHSFTPSRLDAFEPELVLRIVLTFLPEALDPREYTKYIEEVGCRLYLDVDREDVEISVAPVTDICDDEAQKRVKKLRMLHIEAPNFPPHAPNDLLTRFVCHRARRIDQETGLLHLLPALVEPFLPRNEYIRRWYIGTCLPLLRLTLDYYPDDNSLAIPLSDFEQLRGRKGVDVLLKKSVEEPVSGRETIARDIKSLIGPWMYGHTLRKHRQLNYGQHEKNRAIENNKGSIDGATEGMRKISLDGIKAKDQTTGHDWEHLFAWLVSHAEIDLGLVAHAIDDWDGPGDIDLGGIERQGIAYMDDDLQKKLELQYAQAAFASCYVAEADTETTVEDAHSILARLAELLDFIPPPDLATSVDALPRIERHATKLEDGSHSIDDLLPNALLKQEHPLTTPRMETYMLLQMMVYSAYQFSGLQHPISLVSVAKLHFYATADDQLAVLRKMLHGLSKSGARKDESQWSADRAKFIWLWNWGIEADVAEPDNGAGVLGKIPKGDFEEEMLKVFTETSCYGIVKQLYLGGSLAALPKNRAEVVILDKAMETYDSASNGNRQRGAMKKANDIIAAFQPCFPDSARFRQANALIAATHALSFYSLTLQHGVPFQPVTIRASQDPVALVNKVLEQNPRSYTQLDDLIGIARNLVSSGLMNEDSMHSVEYSFVEACARMQKDAERRVIFMAIEAALREDDFETAYSNVVNRLTPSGANLEAPVNKKPSHKRHRSSRPRNNFDEDDISWRAAFLAGRYRPTASAPPTLRRLEQRTELLSLALLLAPTSALTEILAAWRRCEEEMTSLQISQQEAEQHIDDRADRGLSPSALPGTFTVSGGQPELILNQKRREMGRMGAASSRGNHETPLSMFDLTRNAAKVFSKNTFPLGDASAAVISADHSTSTSVGQSFGSLASDTSAERVRKRDMVANAVSGSIVSGLGWVLGATPASASASQNEHEQHQSF